MKTRCMIIIVIALVPLSIPNVSSMCAAEALEWYFAFRLFLKKQGSLQQMLI